MTSHGATSEIRLGVVGMTCVNCAATIERQLKKLDGVTEATVNFAAEKVTVAYDPSILDGRAIVSAIREAVYVVPVA